jgi:hypothetical protein
MDPSHLKVVMSVGEKLSDLLIVQRNLTTASQL